MKLTQKIKPRPIIDEDFRQTYILIMREVVKDIDRRSASNRKAYFSRNPGDMKVISACMKTIEQNRVSDADLIKLYGMDFCKFSGFSRKDKHGTLIHWLVGQTRDVTMIEGTGYDKKSRDGRSWNVGKWYIYVPHTSFTTRTLAGVHLIPESAPKEARYRHPHHYARQNDSQHPIDWEPVTCMGGFGTVFYTLASLADVPETFRLLYTFISRCNTNSILTSRPEYIKWITELPQKEAAVGNQA